MNNNDENDLEKAYPNPVNAMSENPLATQENEGPDSLQPQITTPIEPSQAEASSTSPSMDVSTSEYQNETTVSIQNNPQQQKQKPIDEKFKKGKIIGAICSFIPLPIFAIDQFFLSSFISDEFLRLFFSGDISMEEYENLNTLFNVGLYVLLDGFLIFAMILMIIYKIKNKSASLPVTLCIISVGVTLIGMLPVGCILAVFAGFFQLTQKNRI